MGNEYPYRTGARLLMIPVALIVGIVVGLLWEWGAGLLVAVLLEYVAPELIAFFFKRLRAPIIEEDKYRKLSKEVKRMCVNNPDDDIKYDDGFIPMDL